MKHEIDWAGMLKAALKAIWPFIAGAVGGLFTGCTVGGIVSVSSGCSSMAPSDKTQTMGVYAFGIPSIAVITQSTQAADNAGSDTNAATQSNPVEVSGK